MPSPRASYGLSLTADGEVAPVTNRSEWIQLRIGFRGSIAEPQGAQRQELDLRVVEVGENLPPSLPHR